MCWQLFYHGKWTLLMEVDFGCQGESMWVSWHGVFELHGWLNGACNNL